MSILMAALKQQNKTPMQAADGTTYWRGVAVVLALLLALLIGAAAAYVFMQTTQFERSGATIEPVTPAAPETIMAALNTEQKPLDPVSPNNIDVALNKLISPAPEPITEPFTSSPPVKTVTAGSLAAEPQAEIQVAEKPTAEPETAVSSELRDKFASALKATERGNNNTTERNSISAPATDINSLDTQLQRQIPELRFEAHVYATAANQRWVKVNGKTLQEGQWVTADIRIKEITPQYVLMTLGNQLFSMAALSAWPN
ncbi:general secretion pathway protein GspB [Rheinheimera metallidurans]|uniref:general secretion pathway protein GspB n=1 Tax=Rheinheimera metallidurans TaxID=2925781 RepID=UPI003003984C